MHLSAEAGVIALGNPYALAETPDTEDGERVDPTQPGWLSRLLEWQRGAPDPDTFWSALRDELAQDREITVFSADGGVVGLPDGASCVDAAYSLHGEGAHACVGARVNGRLAPLGTALRDGDTLQLLLAGSEVSGPSPEWLEHAHTPAARIAITRWLDAHPASAAEDEPAAPAVRPAAAVMAPVADPVAETDPPGAAVRLARCCDPAPPEGITGFTIRGGTVAVHRAECPAAARMAGSGRAPVPVRWRTGTSGSGYRATLLAEALGRPRLLADLTEVIATQGAGIVSAAVEPPQEHRVRHTYTVDLPKADDLPALMRAMRAVPGVYDVYRARA
jgi:GTP pyrophosphokinase